jgi:hypothetical protein
VRLLTTAAVDRRDPAALDVITVFTAGQRRTMTGMLAALTGSAHDRTLGSLGLLDDIQQRVDGLRGGLRCGDVASDASDELGPLPQQCSTQGPATPPTQDERGGGIRAGSTADSGTTGAQASTISSPATAGRPAQRGPTSHGSQQAPRPRSSTTSRTPAGSRHSDENIIDRLGRLLGGSLG